MQKWLSTLGKSVQPPHTEKPQEDFGRSIALKEEGNLHLENGDVQRAIACFEQAVRISQSYAEGHCNLGIALKLQNKFQEAERALREAVTISPHLDRAHYHLGTLYAMHGMHEPAAHHLVRTLELDRGFMSCYLDLSLLHFKHGRITLAQQVINDGLDLEPGFAPLYLSRGNLHIAEGNAEQGVAAYRACLALMQGDYQALSDTFQMAQVNLYLVLRVQGDISGAEACLTELIAMNPDAPAALAKLGEIYLERGDPHTAKQYLLRAYATHPTDHDVLNNLGQAEVAVGNLQAGIEYLRRATIARPGWAPPIANLGKAYERAGELTQAANHYQHAVRLDPNSTEAVYRLGLLRLLSGEFQDGWHDYETRWQMPHMRSQRREFAAALWLGQQSLFGKSILIHAEQGMGDTIHAVRFLDRLATTGAAIYLEVQPALRALCARMPSAPFAQKIIARGDPLPKVDFHCPLMSLPLALKIRDFVGLPGRKPYLFAPADREQHYAAALSSTRQRVGVAWRDDQAQLHGIDHSVPLSELLPILSQSGPEFFLLHEPSDQDAALMPALPKLNQTDLPPGQLGDLAALIANMDLVIATDSTIAHLAAAMGKPTWVIIEAAPDWRWMLERPDSPWYPSVKLYRQPRPGAWGDVAVRIANDMRQLFSARA